MELLDVACERPESPEEVGLPAPEEVGLEPSVDEALAGDPLADDEVGYSWEDGAWHLVAFITVLISARNKRLGDMAARTLQVRKHVTVGI